MMSCLLGSIGISIELSSFVGILVRNHSCIDPSGGALAHQEALQKWRFISSHSKPA